jgi:hypothetical protein
LPPEIGHLSNLEHLLIDSPSLTSLPPEIGQLSALTFLGINCNVLMSLPPEIGQLTQLESFVLDSTSITNLPPEIGQLTNLQQLSLYRTHLTFPPPEIMRQGTPAVLAYLRDYHGMMVRQTIAGMAAGVGGIAGLMLAFRWRQRRGITKRKRKTA